MRQLILSGLTLPAAMALLATVAIVLALARLLIALRRPVVLHLPDATQDAPYKVEAQAPAAAASVASADRG